jgi:two-component system response regulator FixJ
MVLGLRMAFQLPVIIAKNMSDHRHSGFSGKKGIKMPMDAVFIFSQDKKLENKLWQVVNANGFGIERWNADVPPAGPEGSGCLVADTDFLLSEGNDQDSSALSGTMPVIALVGNGNVSAAVRAMKLGAFDVLQLPLDEKAFIGTVRQALQQCRDTKNLTTLMQKINQRLGHLTERENQILQLLSAGLTNKEVAIKLSISVRTVEIHRSHIMGKMEARNMTHLVRMMIAVNDRLPAAVTYPSWSRAGFIKAEANHV